MGIPDLRERIAKISKQLCSTTHGAALAKKVSDLLADCSLTFNSEERYIVAQLFQTLNHSLGGYTAELLADFSKQHDENGGPARKGKHK